MRLNPSSLVDDLSNHHLLIEICDFCKQPLQCKEGDRWRYEPCGCPENVENTRHYNEEFERRAAPLLQKAKQQRVARLFEQSRIPARWESRTFEHFVVNETNQKAYEKALEYVEQFRPDSGDSLLLTGPVGTGKTHLAAAISMALMEREHKVVFGTISTLLSEIRYSYSDQHPDNTEAKLFERYTTCDLLVIDDLGKERVSEWTEQLVFDIINTRYENNKALVITTNLGLQNIRKKYRDTGEALVDRLIEVCTGIKLDGESWRRKVIG